MTVRKELSEALFSPLRRSFEASLQNVSPQIRPAEVGTVTSVSRGVIHADGLPAVRSEELLAVAGNIPGLALSLERESVGIVLLDNAAEVQAGAEVRRTGRLPDVPVGDALLGRVIDPLGRPLDNLPPVRCTERRPCECDAPGIMDRLPVTVPLQTGIKVIDALVPVGRGQRELIIGDRQTGKTAVAVDAIINQQDSGVICIYCAIGQRSSSVATVIAQLREHNALPYTIVMAAEGDQPPGLQFLAPFSATAIGEYFMQQGKDVLVVYDDLTAHARAYREIALLLRRSPGREAFPGDIFYLHSRLLERSTHLCERLGGGSLTALVVAATEAQNLAAYIPTNLISITDGQICLSPDLFRKGMLPAVDVGRSVSRVGGKTQLPAYRSVAGALRLSYSQFEELEAFSRFSSRLDDATRATLERGRRVREILKQPRFRTLTVPQQLFPLVAVTEGLLDEIPLDQVRSIEQHLTSLAADSRSDSFREQMLKGKMNDSDRKELIEFMKRSLSQTVPAQSDADTDAGS